RKYGSNGVPRIVNTEVYSARINAIVPNAITTGATPIHISSTFLKPSVKNLLIERLLSAFVKALSMPCEVTLWPSGTSSDWDSCGEPSMKVVGLFVNG